MDKRWSICNAVTCRWRAQLVRSRRDVGSGKQEEPYSCALVVTSTEAIRLAFSGENISSRRLHKTPWQLRWHFGANMGKGGGTFERLLGKLSSHFLSSPLSRQTASSKCDVFPSVLFWQTLGLWLPGQLTGFSRLANNYVIIVRRPRNCH